MRALDPETHELLDWNFLESVREFARWNDRAECVERGGVLLVAGGSAFPVGYTNCAVRIDPGVPAGHVLSTAREFFAGRRRGFTVFVRRSRDADLEALLEGAGARRMTDAPCMGVREPLAGAPSPEGIELRAVRTEAEARDVARVDCEAYESLGFPPGEARVLFARPERMLTPRIIAVIAYRDGEPVSTAQLLRTAGAGGVYWVGTVAGARRSGLGEACTRFVTNAAFTAADRVVTLQASSMGEPIYRRLGYRTFDRLRWYLVPPPA